MSTHAVLGGQFDSGGRAFDVSLTPDSDLVEIVEYRGISPVPVARGRWDEATQRVVGLSVVAPDYVGDLAQLAIDATTKLRLHPGGP